MAGPVANRNAGICRGHGQSKVIVGVDLAGRRRSGCSRLGRSTGIVIVAQVAVRAVRLSVCPVTRGRDDSALGGLAAHGPGMLSPDRGEHRVGAESRRPRARLARRPKEPAYARAHKIVNWTFECHGRGQLRGRGWARAAGFRGSLILLRPTSVQPLLCGRVRLAPMAAGKRRGGLAQMAKGRFLLWLGAPTQSPSAPRSEWARREGPVLSCCGRFGSAGSTRTVAARLECQARHCQWQHGQQGKLASHQDA